MIKYVYSKINIFYLFGGSIDVDQSVVFQSCPQDPTQQVGARFAALAATCVACEAAGAVATMPKSLFHQTLWLPSFRRHVVFHVFQHVPGIRTLTLW